MAPCELMLVGITVDPCELLVVGLLWIHVS